ncbi:MAG: DUF86 domain-containing protein, partial [Chloroflexia bacterium]|nr:DUF86 domain-containing protein [Chloroflexia bacterium]
MLASIDRIGRFAAGLDFEAYLRSELHRGAIERGFEKIGEAMRIASKLDPTLSRRIPALLKIIGPRDRVIHGYDIVDDTIIWGTVQR